MCIERCKHGSNGESLRHHVLWQWCGGLSNYDSVNLSQVMLTATPVEKVKSAGEGKGNKYFIAEFSYKVLDEKQQEDVKLIGESLNIWRSETLTGDASVELSVNYNPPIQQLNGSGSAEAMENNKEEGKITDIQSDLKSEKAA